LRTEGSPEAEHREEIYFGKNDSLRVVMPKNAVNRDRSPIEDTVNEMFCNVKPGFMESANEPVMATPIIVPAAVVAVTGSTLCLVC